MQQVPKEGWMVQQSKHCDNKQDKDISSNKCIYFLVSKVYTDQIYLVISSIPYIYIQDNNITLYHMPTINIYYNPNELIRVINFTCISREKFRM